MDEPFSSLDIEVRNRLKSELSNVLSSCSASGLLVTHDPQEALAICDRVAVMSECRLHQCATPSELVHKPATSFVARFVLQRNVLPIKILDNYINTPIGKLINPCFDNFNQPNELMLDDKCLFVQKHPEGDAVVQGCEFQGNHWLMRVAFKNHRFRIYHPLEDPLRPGDKCFICFSHNKYGILFPGAIQCSLNKFEH